jgi:anion-transporting  ArsA/GET3 family ATPase
VGKSAVAAGIARLAAQRGKRVLVCEMDDKGSLASYLGRDSVGFEPVEVETNVFAMAMNTEDSLREYLRLFVRVPIIGSLAPLAKIFEFVANAAPAVKEILAIGKICHEVREGSYDLIVVDAEATGHFVAQISAPDALMRVVQLGVIADQTAWMRDILHDLSRTCVVAVTTAEELPVTETIELRDRLAAATPTPIAAIVVNRVESAITMTSDEIVAVADPQVETGIARATGNAAAVARVLAALRTTTERARHQVARVEELRAAFGSDVELVTVAEAGGRVVTPPHVTEWIVRELASSGGGHDAG